MIKYLYGNDLERFPALRHSMFEDRASQFSARLGWDVTVDRHGEERDEYDQLNPLYIVIEDSFGHHLGSMRLLPSIGRTMVNEHFSDMMGGVVIRSPSIWECTRFCIAPRASRRIAPLLMAAGAKLMKEFSLSHYVAVFDERMLRVYAMIGSTPTVIGTSSSAQGQTSVGLWDYCDIRYQRLLRCAGVSQLDMELFFTNGSFACEHDISQSKSA